MAKTANKYYSKKYELTEIAEKLFIEKGYEETSIEDILKASGLSKGGFYHYFKSKEEVLSESISNLMENSLKELESIIDNDSMNALEKLKLFMEKKSELQNNKKEFAKYLSMIMKSDFTLYKYYISLAEKYVNPLARIIEQGVRENIFDVKFPRETADIMLRAVTSLPQSAFFSEYLHNETSHNNYSASLKDVIARILGVDSTAIWTPDGE
ncbi:MAG: hypothetical protein K0S71_2892 [Clostridia bacterium]|jgi:AcrR family transcriptional regulator|nr:hypothetical protein [Clostridia bacterium]